LWEYIATQTFVYRSPSEYSEAITQWCTDNGGCDDYFYTLIDCYLDTCYFTDCVWDSCEAQFEACVADEDCENDYLYFVDNNVGDGSSYVYYQLIEEYCTNNTGATCSTIFWDFANCYLSNCSPCSADLQCAAFQTTITATSTTDDICGQDWYHTFSAVFPDSSEICLTITCDDSENTGTVYVDSYFATEEAWRRGVRSGTTLYNDITSNCADGIDITLDDLYWNETGDCEGVYEEIVPENTLPTDSAFILSYCISIVLSAIFSMIVF